MYVLAQLRLHKNDTTAAAPEWWPEAKYDDALLARIGRAEAVGSGLQANVFIALSLQQWAHASGSHLLLLVCDPGAARSERAHQVTARLRDERAEQLQRYINTQSVVLHLQVAVR